MYPKMYKMYSTKQMNDIQEGKGELVVLDLDNPYTYGSIPHKMVETTIWATSYPKQV